MEIYVTTGVSTGETPLSAFDGALFNAGVANFNLLRLSSVIPPGALVTQKPLDWNLKAVGQRLYCVYASLSEKMPGRRVYAGIGWCQRQDGSGVFIEHEGHSEEEVQDLIIRSLNEMKMRRGGSWGENQRVITGIQCADKPVCALVIAAYKIEDWG